MEALVKLLHDDAYQSMPPFAMWIRGAEDITAWMVRPGPSGCRGSKLIPLGEVNGCPAFAQYRPEAAGGMQPWGIQLIEISGGKIAELAIFPSALAPERLFPFFGLPAHLDH